jgi:hypothetical protein
MIVRDKADRRLGLGHTALNSVMETSALSIGACQILMFRRATLLSDMLTLARELLDANLCQTPHH